MAGLVFLCYARKDEKFVLPLAQALKARGAPIWIDQWELTAASDWDSVIDEKLDECTAFLIVLSKNSIKSREVRSELRIALDDDKPIVPVLMEKCRIPRQLRLIHHVDFTDSEPDDESALAHILGALGLESSAPTVGLDLKAVGKNLAPAGSSLGLARQIVAEKKEAEKAEKKREAEEARRAKKEEAERKAEVARKAKEEEKRRQEEEARKAIEEQERREEAERRKAAEEAERKQKEEEARKAREEQERREEEERQKAAEEAERKRQEEEARQAKEEQERREEEERRKAAEEAERKRQEEEARRKKEEEDRLWAEAVRRAEEKADRKLQEEARKKMVAEEEARRQAELARKAAEAEAARKKKEEEARKAAEEEERRQAELARKAAEAEAARKKKEEEAHKAAEEEERRQAELARKAAEAEAARKKKEEEAREAAEEEERRQAEQARKAAEAEAARKKKEEEARKAAEEEERRQAELARRAAEAEAAREKEEEEARQAAEEEERRQAELALKASKQKAASKEEEPAAASDSPAQAKAQADAPSQRTPRPSPAKPSDTGPRKRPTPSQRTPYPGGKARQPPKPNVAKIAAIAAAGLSSVALAYFLLSRLGTEGTPPSMTGSLDVQVATTDARVFVNGEPVSTGAYQGDDLSPGSYEVRVEREGYVPFSRYVDVVAGETSTLRVSLTPEEEPPLDPEDGPLDPDEPPVEPDSDPPPVPTTGVLVVAASSAEAEVFVDDRSVGQAPVDGRELEPGEHLVRVEKDGFETYRRRVNIVAGRTTRLDANLVPVPVPPTTGTLLIASTEEGAVAFLDDESVGALPWSSDLGPGRYVVRVTKDGFYEFTQSVDISAGNHTEVMADLKPEVVEAPEDVRPTDPNAWVAPKSGIAFRLIKGGTFTMGSQPGEAERQDDEIPHRVTLSRDFWMAETEVTRAQWRAVMNRDPSEFPRCNDCPVDSVAWLEAVEMANTLSQLEGLDACYQLSPLRFTGLACTGFRLPTEAEWEYAARGRAGTPFWSGPSLSSREANFDGSKPYGGGAPGPYRRRPRPVRSFPPNQWGLFDVHGNVMEWVWDWHGDYPKGSVTDPIGPSSGRFRVWRGGSWGHAASELRSARRDGAEPSTRSNTLGFRLARTAP